MFSAIQSLFRKPNKPEEYPGLKVKYQVFWADYGVGKVMSTWDTKDGAMKAIQQLVPCGNSYAIREVLVSAG